MSTETDIDIELGAGSWLGLVATVNLLGMDPLTVFKVQTYLH